MLRKQHDGTNRTGVKRNMLRVQELPHAHSPRGRVSKNRVRDPGREGGKSLGRLGENGDGCLYQSADDGSDEGE